MMARVTVCLEENERAALQQMSEFDCRPPRDQIRYLLREEASRRGLFNGVVKSDTNRKAASRDTGMSTRNDQTSDPRQV